MAQIEIEHLSKRFGRRTAVRDLCLEVPARSIYGLLGHNGAGKSTTIGLLLGHLSPDKGKARIGGIPVQRQRFEAIRKVGALFETPAFYPYLSGYRNLEIFGAYSGKIDPRELEEVVALVGLEARIRDRVGGYSHGMRQRLAIAQALLPAPSVLILDEPTDGLDPEGIREMRLLVQRLHRERPLTILLSSHLLGEVEQLCDRIGILHEGKLLFSGDWRRQAAKERRFRFEVDDPERCATALVRGGLAVWANPSGNGNGSRGFLDAELGKGAGMADCVVLLVGHGHRLHGCTPLAPSLEAFYLTVVQQARKEAAGR